MRICIYTSMNMFQYSRAHLVACTRRSDERRFIVYWALLCGIRFTSNKVWSETLQVFHLNIRRCSGLVNHERYHNGQLRSSR